MDGIEITEPKDELKEFLKEAPSRQALRSYLITQAEEFLKQSDLPRRERRLLSHSIAKRLAKKVLNGEDIDAVV